ncbi:MAG: deoxyribose-phosphate aldolase [Clostridia bacterium]|nr:deoxyribose-phosphate aldolase [Clostridia bacterium]
MDKESLLHITDHTLLKPDATWEQIQTVCDEGLRFRTASVCIPPNHVAKAASYLRGRLPICTVIGFPCGYQTTSVKVFETRDAIQNGADEIDMVISIGWLKDRRFDDLLAEIRAIKATCGEKILKVIVETCLLSDEEKIRMCQIVSESGADFIKTSTGFSTGGATAADIRLFAAHIAPSVKIKAAGGISSFHDAAQFAELGASRLGTSRLVKLMLLN